LDDSRCSRNRQELRGDAAGLPKGEDQAYYKSGTISPKYLELLLFQLGGNTR
jgi:hypothetical protein